MEVKELVEKATAREKAQFAVFNGAVVKCTKAYNEDPTEARLRNLRAAETALEALIAELKSHHLTAKEEAKQPDQERFVNRKQALNWLTAQGYKVSQGKFYQDCKEGFPVMHRDGSVSKFEVMQYGQQLDVSARSVVPDTSRENEARKAAAEADMAEMKAERMRREEDAEWLHADQAWASMAGILGTLRDCIRHHFHAAQNELVHVAGGDLNRNTEVFEFCDDIVNRAFNEVAGDSINVTFEKGEE